MDFTDEAYSFIQKRRMFGQGGSVTVGISGGADSVCLFLQLIRLRDRLGITLHAVTVEHGIRGDESVHDAEFSRSLCEKYGVDCTVAHVDAPKRAAEKGISLEEAARQLRYEAFLENTPEGGYIALAHHMEDQAETVIFHMIRGSGVRGLIGMRPVTDYHGRKIARPLLFATKARILAELERSGQDYCTDSTNSDTSYSRNRIRSVIVPELEKINSGAVRHICESAESVGELYDRFFEEESAVLAPAFIRGERKEDNRIRIAQIRELDDTARRLVIMEYLRRTLRSIKDVSREHLNRLSELVAGSEHFSYNLPKGAVISLEYGILKVTYRDDKPQSLPQISLEQLEADGRCGASIGDFSLEFTLVDAREIKRDELPVKNYEKWFDYDKIMKGLCLRGAKDGDFFIIDSAGHKKKYRDYCKNEKIPADEREQIPLLVCDGSHIVWAIGYRISEDVKVTEETKRILMVSAVTGTAQ